jgi:hypothetical protein
MSKRKAPPAPAPEPELPPDEGLFAEGLAAWSPSELLEGVTEAEWIKAQGWTPLEFLVHTYRNPWQEPRDRISAAKAVLEYTHRKLPQRLEIDGNVITTKKLNAESLGKLSDSELEVFIKLLEKMNEK